MEQEISTNFFESVAKHDLERFHSECLCWLFNNNKKLAAEWIKQITKSEFVIDIDSIEVFTEVDQLDIVLIYKENSKNEDYFGIVIENKVKANEHLIKVKKNEQLLNFKIGDVLSQTEYYYFRNIATKEIVQNEKESENYKILVQILGDRSKINKSKNTIYKFVKRENCQYVFLVPNKIQDINPVYPNYKYDELNEWDSNKCKSKNPWVTYTYIELADFLFNIKDDVLKNPKSKNETYANDYIVFLHSQFKEIVNLNIYSSNKYGKLEYMKFLRHAIFLKLNDECRELNKNGKVDSKSSNSGDPLFNIVICDKIEIELTEYKELFQLGLQVQGLTYKIYISAGENYNSLKFNPKGSDVEIDELNKYRNLVEKEFDKIINKETGNFLFEYEGDIKLFPNKNTTKSFYSYSFTFENEDKNGIDLSDKIYKLSHLINEIYDIYNKTSFTSTSESNSKLSK